MVEICDLAIYARFSPCLNSSSKPKKLRNGSTDFLPTILSHSFSLMHQAAKAQKNTTAKRKLTWSLWPEGELQGQSKVVVRSREMDPVGLFLCLGQRSAAPAPATPNTDTDTSSGSGGRRDRPRPGVGRDAHGTVVVVVGRGCARG